MLDRLQSYIPTALLFGLIFYFGTQAMIGPRGLLLIRARGEALKADTAELNQLKGEQQDLEIRARLLRDQSLSADLLEERARYLLGVADPRDYVIRTKP
ncbi:MAG: septum formation initiator family protein [Caulobacteraceae bacterium]|nr:septum formation initiator family protein [Caulobacteraceae bacterium]